MIYLVLLAYFQSAGLSTLAKFLCIKTDFCFFTTSTPQAFGYLTQNNFLSLTLKRNVLIRPYHHFHVQMMTFWVSLRF